MSIVCCGPPYGGLSYHSNNKIMQDGQTIIMDQEHMIHHYCSDVTSCFPVNGKFTQKQREIYTIVYNASRAAISLMKPGVSFAECHIAAEKAILQGLKDLGILNGEVDEMH